MFVLYIVLYSLKNRTSWIETPLQQSELKKEKREEKKKDKPSFIKH